MRIDGFMNGHVLINDRSASYPCWPSFDLIDEMGFEE